LIFEESSLSKILILCLTSSVGTTVW